MASTGSRWLDRGGGISARFYPYWCQSWTDPRSWRPSCQLGWVPATAAPSAVRPLRPDLRIRSLNGASAAPALECSRGVPRRLGTLARRTDSCRAPNVTGCQKRDSGRDKERSLRTPVWNQSLTTWSQSERFEHIFAFSCGMYDQCRIIVSEQTDEGKGQACDKPIKQRSLKLNFDVSFVSFVWKTKYTWW